MISLSLLWNNFSHSGHWICFPIFSLCTIFLCRCKELTARSTSQMSHFVTGILFLGADNRSIPSKYVWSSMSAKELANFGRSFPFYILSVKIFNIKTIPSEQEIQWADIGHILSLYLNGKWNPESLVSFLGSVGVEQAREHEWVSVYRVYQQ